MQGILELVKLELNSLLISESFFFNINIFEHVVEKHGI